MTVFKNIIFSFTISALCLFNALSSEIIQIDNLYNIQDKLLQLNDDSLVLFDVDYTLIIPDDAILRPSGLPKAKILVKNILQNSPSYPAEYYRNLPYPLGAKVSLVDNSFPSLVRKLQQNGVRAMALTAAPAGKLNEDNCLEDRRINELEELGFVFTSAFSFTQMDFAKREDRDFLPAYKSGILFSSKHSKGEVLKQFLNSIEWRPKRVVFLDDRIEYLQSVEKVMNELEIDFTGVHYTAAEKLTTDLDEELAEFQFRYLAEHSKWLSDQEAKEYMGKGLVAQ